MPDERFPLLEDLKIRGESALLDTRRMIADMHEIAQDARGDARRHRVRMDVVAVNGKKRA